MRMRTIALAGLAGAAVTYFFDPISGNARRRRLGAMLATLTPGRAVGLDEIAPLPENMAPTPATQVGDVPGMSEERTTTEVADSASEASMGDAADGAEERPTGAEGTREDQDDGAIAQRVRMRLQERPDLETGDLVIDVVRGVAYLRGDLNDRQRLDEIADLTASVPGVRRVQSLLHLSESETINPVTRPVGDAWNG
jgi:hypothetical protein